jgi:mannobiose 2-epimerase
MLEFQARQTRTAARLALAFPSEPRWAEIARHGFRYLRDVMWDRQHGGWFWMIARDGRLLENATKHGHSIAYAVHACALVHAATGDPAALELAHEGFAWFDRHAYDSKHGGYQAWLHRDGRIISQTVIASPDPLGFRIGSKDVNVHGDWIESLTAFLQVDGDARVRFRLQDLVRLFVGRLISDEGALYQLCHRNWQPQPTLERYGYPLQTVHRLFAAQPVVDNPSLMETRALRVLDHAISRAWAGDTGGFWYAGPAGPPDEIEGVSLIVRRRIWWPQMEGLRSLLLCGLRENGRQYAALFQAQWRLVRDRMSDLYFGGVYGTCPDDLSSREQPRTRWTRGPALRKGDVWKDASHETESLVESIRRLRNRSTGAI